MIKANKYFLETIQEIKESGFDSVNPRTKWSDGQPAHYKYTLPKIFTYDISKREFPINTLRPTAIKGAFHDIAAIYQKQTNIIEDMDPSIHSWWTDFVVEENNSIRSIGKTYGDTVLRYDLMNKLLEQIKKDPFGRRNLLDLWQVQQMIDDPKALVPCCFLTMYTITEEDLPDSRCIKLQNDTGYIKHANRVRKLHLTMIQRSMDCCMTFSINPLQYTMLGMMICTHLNNETILDNEGYYYEMGTLTHFVQNPHIYDRHFPAVEELLAATITEEVQPYLSLLRASNIIKTKNFYDITWDDFTVRDYYKPKELSYRLPIAI